MPAITSLRAHNRVARWLANVSAFTLNKSPSRPMPMHAMIGTKPFSSKVVSNRVSAFSTGTPTRPRLDHSSVDRAMRRRGFGQPAAAICAGQPHRRDACNRHRGDESCIDGPGQNRHDNIQRRLVGDAKAVDLALFDPGGFQRDVDLATATVNDNERRRCGDLPNRGETRVCNPDASSSSSPPNFRTEASPLLVSHVTTARFVRRCRA